MRKRSCELLQRRRDCYLICLTAGASQVSHRRQSADQPTALPTNMFRPPGISRNKVIALSLTGWKYSLDARMRPLSA